MFHLFQFHLALCPPHLIVIDNLIPSGSPLCLEFAGVVVPLLLNPHLAKPQLRVGKIKPWSWSQLLVKRLKLIREWRWKLGIPMMKYVGEEG